MTAMVLPMVNLTAMSILNATMVEKQEVLPVHENHMLLFSRRYREVHGYVSNGICVFGVISNILNVIVLTRRHMITPTNCILTALAVTDLLTMLAYLVYTAYFYIYKQPEIENNHSQVWMYLVIVSSHIYITFHNMALWFTVSLAVFRYIFVCHNVIGNRMCSLQRAILTITIIVIVTIIACIPNYLKSRVVKLTDFGLNFSGYWIIDTDLVAKHSFYEASVYWFYGVIMKVVPCILLILLSAMVILAMHKASKRRASLLQQTRSSGHDVNREHNRTTWMLVSIVLFSVITELPQGILNIVSGMSEIVYMEVYVHLVEVMDLFVLLNSVVNFVLYCCMSKQFRDTFNNLFVVKFRCANHRTGE